MRRRPAARPRLALLALLAALGCAPGTTSREGQDSASARGGEARCEHGLAEELCPKCHPELAAIYQANRDWCAEHGMPESFCPICHPEAKGRPSEGGPAKKPEATSTQAPKDRTKVQLKSLAIVEGAGLETARAVKAPAKTAVRFPARVVYDATRTAEITASAGGVLRSVAVDVGAKVQIGDVLATLDSAEVGGHRSRLAAAYRRVKAAEDRVARVAALEKDGVVPKKERVEAELALDDANADAASLAAELGVSGASAGSGATYVVRSPLAGIVTKRAAAVGRLVDDKEALFQVVDPTVLWAELDVPEATAASIREGAEVALTFGALPAESFAGAVAALLPEVDPHTRTVTARVAVENQHLRLRANMFGQAAVLGDAPAEGVTVPRAAVQTVDRQRFVFIRKSPLLFEVRHVTVATREGATVLLADGVDPGEEVVTTGAFLLKTETLKDSIGAGCCADD
jgi:cobalt-zinc-cadmium efflux system membrane fusion protein